MEFTGFFDKFIIRIPGRYFYNIPPMTKILIADDHQLYSDGLRYTLEKEFTVVSQIFHGRDVLFEIQRHFPHLAILDINLPGTNGLDLGRVIRNDFPEVKLVFLSMYREEAFIKIARDMGAGGYFCKESSGADILQGIKRVLGGESVFETSRPEIRSGHSHDYFVKTFSLSRRELEVIRQIRLGMSSEQIAEAMCLSYETIKSHRKNIFFKLNIGKVSELIAFAIQNGI